jgi:serine/threonine protein kinase
MKITVLPKTGVRASERHALFRIEKAFPEEWKGYSSLEIVSKGALDREIDLLVLASDRLIIVELKQWNGRISSDGDYWYVNDSRRERSPVAKNRDKSRILKSLIEKNVAHGSEYLVDQCVVLCGNSPSPTLPDEEVKYVLQLENFLRLPEKRSYERQFPPRQYSTRSPHKFWKDFDQFIQRSKSIKPREFSYQNYRVTGAELFAHPAKLYLEYKAQNRDDANNSALLRRWDFSKLGVERSDRDLWVSIAQRESRVFNYLRARTDELESTLLSPVSPTADNEVVEDHCELFSLPLKQKRLFEFNEAYRGRLRPDERLDIVRVLVSKFADLHRNNIAHRDIGDHSIWLERPQSIKISSFVAAYFPEMETVGAIREDVVAATTKLPEDELGDAGSAFQRDVFQLGVAAHTVLFERTPKLATGVAEWSPIDNDPFEGALDDWFLKALQWDTSHRFKDAVEMSEFLNAAQLRKDEVQVAPLELLERYRALTKLDEYENKTDATESGDADCWRASHKGVDCRLKVWYVKPAVGATQANYSLLLFLERAFEARNASSPWLAKVLDAGLCRQGVLMAREWVPGKDLRQWLKSSPDVAEICTVVSGVIEGVSSLHDAGYAHGDIHPSNIVVRSDLTENVRQVTFIDSPDWRFGDPAPFNPAYAPERADLLSAVERDRYAAVKVAIEALREAARRSDSPESLDGAAASLQRILDEQPAVLGLGPVQQELQRLLASKATAVPIIKFSLLRSPADVKPGPLLQDNGTLYIWSKERSDGQVSAYVTGPGYRVVLRYDAQSLAVQYADVERITHSQLQFAMRSGGSIPVALSLELGPGRQNELHDLIDFIEGTRSSSLDGEESDASEHHEGIKSWELREPEPKQRTTLDVKEVWKNLTEAEEDALVEVRITGVGFVDESDKNLLRVPYTTSDSLDYPPDEEIELFLAGDSGDRRRVGVLDQRRTTESHLGVNRWTGALQRASGNRLTLQGRRDRLSYEKRLSAVQRILRGAAVNPDLLSHFDRSASAALVRRYREPTDEELRRFDIYKDERRVFSLNDDQLGAFKKLYSHGPVSLLQGPPGTGKTDFIAAFLNYIVQVEGAKHVLIVSQSHEATNNALGRAIALAEHLGQPLEVVRVGDDGQLSDEVRFVGVSALQESYRERFKAQAVSRIAALGPRLGLPRAFVEEYADAFWHLKRLVREISSIDLRLKTPEDDEREELLQKKRGRTESLTARLRSLLGEVPEEVEVEESLFQLKQNLSVRHEVRSPDAVERLDKLVSISQEWVDVLGASSGNFAEFLARTRSIVAGTCVGIGRWNLGIAENKYDWVLIDEAARCTPSELAVAMQVGRRILLVGDHFQLPPFYKDEVRAAVSRRLRLGLDSDVFDSDFERAFESEYGHLSSAALGTQYRMAEDIGALVSDCFYSERRRPLRAGRPNPPDYYQHALEPLDRQILWVDSAGLADGVSVETGRSLRNVGETRVVMAVLRSILENDALVTGLIEEVGGFEHAPIGVIAMYSAQVDDIRRAIARAEWMGARRQLVRVDTVDSYQGKENRIVVVSLVRNSKKGGPGFLSSPNRLNVAISRAMDRLVVVGASSMWGERFPEAPPGVVYSGVRLLAAAGKARIVEAKTVVGGAHG